MVRLKIYGEEIACDKAVKGIDFVKLYTGDRLDRECRVTTFEGYELIEGEWSNPEPTVEDYLLDYEFRLSVMELGGL